MALKEVRLFNLFSSSLQLILDQTAMHLSTNRGTMAHTSRKTVTLRPTNPTGHFLILESFTCTKTTTTKRELGGLHWDGSFLLRQSLFFSELEIGVSTGFLCILTQSFVHQHSFAPSHRCEGAEGDHVETRVSIVQTLISIFGPRSELLIIAESILQSRRGCQVTISVGACMTVALL